MVLLLLQIELKYPDKCKEVNFFISIDGYGETNDRVLEGSSGIK